MFFCLRKIDPELYQNLFLVCGLCFTLMSESPLPTEEEIIEELKESAKEYDLVSEELVEELYLMEKDYSTMERRHGITRDVRQLIEEHADTDEV